MSSSRVLWAAVGLTLANAAWADDGGSGASCGPWTWHDQGDADNPILSFDPRGVLNGSLTDWGELTCGFIRQTSASPTHVYIDFQDTSSLALSCTVRMLSWNGDEQWSASASSVAGADSPYGWFGFTIPTTTTGYGSIDCAIPPFQPGDVNPSMMFGFSVE